MKYVLLMINNLIFYRIIKKQINSDNKVGQITKEYIEENREILKEIKKKSKETDYEPT